MAHAASAGNAVSGYVSPPFLDAAGQILPVFFAGTNDFSLNSALMHWYASPGLLSGIFNGTCGSCRNCRVELRQHSGSYRG